MQYEFPHEFIRWCAQGLSHPFALALLIWRFVPGCSGRISVATLLMAGMIAESPSGSVVREPVPWLEDSFQKLHSGSMIESSFRCMEFDRDTAVTNAM
jgi:hypothetical protein